MVSGDPITVSNPEGTFDTNRLQSVTQSVLLAAGSGMLIDYYHKINNNTNTLIGLTPMLSVLHDLLGRSSSGSDQTPSKHHLIFANKTEKDILWRKELDALAKDNKK